MNTEQQLRQRAEASLKKHHCYPFLTGIDKSVLDAMLDFHKQELQRIGEVYVPCTAYEISQLSPNEDGFAYSQKLGWLKKLSLLEVKDLEASDNKKGSTCCDAPFKDTNSI